MTLVLRKWLDKLKLLLEFSRYTLVGGLAFIFDFGLLYILTKWGGLHYLLSATIAFTVGLIVNYVLSILWVFAYRSCEDKRLEFALFAIVGVGGIVLTDVSMAVLTPLLYGNYLLAKGITAILVFLWNFFLRRQLLFAEDSQFPIIQRLSNFKLVNINGKRRFFFVK